MVKEPNAPSLTTPGRLHISRGVARPSHFYTRLRAPLRRVAAVAPPICRPSGGTRGHDNHTPLPLSAAANHMTTSHGSESGRDVAASAARRDRRQLGLLPPAARREGGDLSICLLRPSAGAPSEISLKSMDSIIQFVTEFRKGAVIQSPIGVLRDKHSNEKRWAGGGGDDQ